MSGFEGDLSDKQQLALGELKHRLFDIWKEDFTDRLLLRFLRARDFELGKAENMLRECLIWRQQNNIDSILETYKSPEVLRRYFPGSLCNHDRDGRPLYIMRFGNGDFSGIAQCVSMDAIVKHAAYQIEVAIADMKTQTEKLRRVVETVTVVFDYDNFHLKQVYCWQVREILRHLTALYEKYYPEILERCLIINAPSFFPIFWKLLQPFLAENTKNKIEIFSRENWQPVMLQYVDPSQLPAHWGGDLVGPDGDEECTYLVGRGGKVPPELYLRNSPRVSADSDATTCFLERGKKMEATVRVERAGTRLQWRFQTNPGHDLGFGIAYVSGENGISKELLPLSRLKCDQVAESGEVCCPEPGTCIFTFDNSYSWFAKKQLSYVFHLKHPEDTSNPGHE
ncbi:unnamed protein product [Ixodes persulcatus]